MLAITIRDKLYDGRFSSANKAWAQAFPIEPDIDSWGGNRNLTLVVRQTHPGLLNLFCNQAKAYESEKDFSAGKAEGGSEKRACTLDEKMKWSDEASSSKRGIFKSNSA